MRVSLLLLRQAAFLGFLGLGGVAANSCLAQEPAPSQAVVFQPAALLEVQQLLSSVTSVKDELLQLRLKCRIWDLLWTYRPVEARSAMRELADQILTASFPKELKARGKTEILGVLFRREPDEAWKLNGKTVDDLRKSGSRLNALADEILEASPEAAAAILKEALPADPSRNALSSLWKLREINPGLAEEVADGALRAIADASGTRGISLANSLAYYFFADGPGTVSSLNSGAFFSSALQLIQAVSETPPALISEAIQRQMLLNTLESMAPRFAPGSIPEIQGLSARLSAISPANGSDGNTLAASGAIKGLIDHDDERALGEALQLDDSPLREKLIDQLRLKKVNDSLRRRDFELAFEDAGKLSDQTKRLDALARIARAAEQNPGWVTEACIDSIRQTIESGDPELIAVLRAITAIYEINPDAGLELHTLANSRLNTKLNSKMSPEELRRKDLELAVRNIYAAAAKHSRTVLNTAINDPYLSLTARLAVLELQLK